MLLPLGTRGSVPTTPAPFVRRPRLEQLLGDESRRRVTLVSAPPGSGKTTLLAGWYRDRPGRRQAWLTLDARDDAADHLVGDVLRALARAGALPDVAAGAPGGDPATLDGAFEDMRDDHPCVLVLDDVHELTSNAVLAVLRHLIERAPPPLQLVVASRVDPPFGVSQVAHDGGLRQIRLSDLAFTRAEAARLLVSEGLHLDEDSLTALWDRTGGRAAGLRLAACSLQRGADPDQLLAGVDREGGADADVTEYLLHAVLGRQEEQVQRLLLRTSIVDRVTPELARLLSEDPEAGERLAELERGGVFAARLEGADWARLHPLLSSRLRVRLRVQDPTLARRLHHRAAAWHAECGMAFEAEELARDGQDWPLLAQLRTRRWLDATLAGADVPAPLVGDLDGATVERTPMLRVLAAVDGCLAHDVIAAEAHRRVLDDAAPAAADVAAGDPLAVGTALLDVVHGWTFGDTARSEEAARLLDASPVVGRRARPLLALVRADGHLDVDDVGAARVGLGPLADEAGTRAVAIEATARLALLDAVAGNLAAATGRIAEVRAAPGAPAQAAAVADLAGLLCASQRGRPPAPSDATFAPLGAIHPHALRCAARSVSRALATPGPITGLDDEAVHHPFAGRALVALGVLAARDRGHRVVALGGPAEVALGRARRALAAGDHGTVIEVLARHLGTALPTTSARTRTEASVLAAVAWAAADEADRAVDAVRGTLEVVGRDGLLAPVIAHAAALAPLVDRLATGGGPHPRAVAALRRVVCRADAPSCGEPLTDREQTVLRFLPTMMTNGEIAASMHLSVNTVKTHLKSVYRKLEVERRRDAVVRARQLGLL